MHIFTPAKIILSGEHSVVYGAPAIGAPVSLFLHSEWKLEEAGSAIVLGFGGENIELAAAWSDLPEKLTVYQDRYQSFKDGTLQIKDVLPEEYDLVTLTFAKFHARYAPELPAVFLSVKTDIPISCGMGSSSALIVNLLQGLLQLAGMNIPEKELLNFAREIEDFQHGVSSGIDLALVSTRHPVLFKKDEGIVKAVTAGVSSLMLVNSGKPEVSTGECVAYVRESFANDNALWARFAACTAQIEKAFVAGNIDVLQEYIFENQSLLESIGVVPKKVAGFIARCKEEGIAAKVCGAGAVSGDTAGMVWVLAEGDARMQALQKIIKEYGYEYGEYNFAS